MTFEGIDNPPHTSRTGHAYGISGDTALIEGSAQHISRINPYHSIGYPHCKNFFQLQGVDMHEAICGTLRYLRLRYCQTQT